MPDALDLLGWLTLPRAPSDTVAWRHGGAVCWHEFIERAGAWRSLLQGTPEQGFALYHTDAVEFAAALFGAWHAGKIIYLPGDSLPNTCATLRRAVDGYLGEFSPQWNLKYRRFRILMATRWSLAGSTLSLSVSCSIPPAPPAQLKRFQKS